MLISEWYKEKNRKEREREFRQIVGREIPEDFPVGYDGGYALGRAMVDELWLDWLQRMSDAAATGQEFTELPPGKIARPKKPFWKRLI